MRQVDHPGGYRGAVENFPNTTFTWYDITQKVEIRNYKTKFTKLFVKDKKHHLVLFEFSSFYIINNT